jgi:hypothetical protein
MLVKRAKLKDEELKEKQRKLRNWGAVNETEAAKLRGKIALIREETAAAVKKLDSENAEALMQEFHRRGY